jgi:integrase
VYLVTEAGHPYSVKGFGNWFARRCREAGLDAGLSAHGLRKLAAVRCVEAGATEHQLMALFGWSSSKQAALYTRRANRAKLEREAAPLLQGLKENESVPLLHAVGSGGTSRARKP